MNPDFEHACRAVSTLKALYFRYMDTKDYEGLDRLFAPDAVIDVRGSGGAPGNGAVSTLDGDGGLMDGASFCRFLRETLQPLVTVHHGHMPEFTQHPDGRVEAIWAMDDLIIFPEGAPFRRLRGWGHYHDVYAPGGKNGWVIVAMKLSRLRVEVA